MRRRPATSPAIGDEHLFPSNRHGDFADEGRRPRPAGDRGAQDDDRRHPQPAEFPRCPAGDSANERGVQGVFGRRDQAARCAKEAPKLRSPNINPRIAEFDLLASGAPFIGSDTAGSFFYAETLPRDGLGFRIPGPRSSRMWSRCIGCVKSTCLYGFTRLEPPPTSAESELDEIQLAVNGADLSRNVEWLPAIEQFGEGIFLHIAPDVPEEVAGESGDRGESCVASGIASVAKPNASIARPFTSAPHTGRSIPCPTRSWRSWPWSAVIRSPH